MGGREDVHDGDRIEVRSFRGLDDRRQSFRVHSTALSTPVSNVTERNAVESEMKELDDKSWLAIR